MIALLILTLDRRGITQSSMAMLSLVKVVVLVTLIRIFRYSVKWYHPFVQKRLMLYSGQFPSTFRKQE